MIEVMITVVLIAILSLMAAIAIGNKIQKARLAACFADLRSIQSTIFLDFGVDDKPPNPDIFWEKRWRGNKPGPYWYLVDNNDPDSGHGNDLDNFDEENPGSAPRMVEDIDFIIVCQHDHGDLAYYVYIVDEGPPTIANKDYDPHFDSCIDGVTGACGPTGSGGTTTSGPGNSGGSPSKGKGKSG